MAGRARCAVELNHAQLIIKTLSAELAQAKSLICSLSNDDASSWKLLQDKMMCPSPMPTTRTTKAKSMISSLSREEHPRKLLQATPVPSLVMVGDLGHPNTRESALDNNQATAASHSVIPEHQPRQLPVAVGRLDPTDNRYEQVRKRFVIAFATRPPTRAPLTNVMTPFPTFVPTNEIAFSTVTPTMVPTTAPRCRTDADIQGAVE